MGETFLGFALARARFAFAGARRLAAARAAAVGARAFVALFVAVVRLTLFFVFFAMGKPPFAAS